MEEINFNLLNFINKNFKELTDEINQLKEQNKELTNKINRLEEKNNIFNNDDVHYLYYIVNGDENRFKIGITQNLESRLSSIQTSNHKPIKLITKIVGTKEEIVELEKMLKDKMSNYNVNGEWFEMDYEKRQSLLNYLNRLNYNFYIDEDKINKDKINKDKINKDEINKDEINKDENETKLSSLEIKEIIDLFKKNELMRLKNKLIFINDLTNQTNTDYDYFLEKTCKKNNIKNDLKKNEVKDLFKKLNKEYIVCFDEYVFQSIDELTNDESNIDYSIWPKEIKDILDFVDAESIDDLIGIHLNTFYQEYINRGGNMNKSNFKKVFSNHGYEFKTLSKKVDNRNFVCRNVLQSINKKINKKILDSLVINKKDYFINSESVKNFNFNDIKKLKELRK